LLRVACAAAAAHATRSKVRFRWVLLEVMDVRPFADFGYFIPVSGEDVFRRHGFSRRNARPMSRRFSNSGFLARRRLSTSWALMNGSS